MNFLYDREARLRSCSFPEHILSVDRKYCMLLKFIEAFIEIGYSL